MTHNLVKHSKHFECSVCGQTWKSRSRTRCPELHVYPKNAYGPLRTKTQLGYEDYETSANLLPAPVGCFQTSAGGAYILLYDPSQAVKRAAPHRRRATTSITHMAWPVSCVPFLESYEALAKIRSYRHEAEDMSCRRLERDIVNIAASLQAFTPDELSHIGGGVIDLSMPPTMIRRAYPRRDANQNEQTTLLARIMAAYRNHLSSVSSTVKSHMEEADA